MSRRCISLLVAPLFALGNFGARAEVATVSVDVAQGSGVAVIQNGPTTKDLDRWRSGEFQGWGGCILVQSESSGQEEICGCLGRQLSAVGPLGVRVALDNVKSCAALFIAGAWDSNWSPAVRDQAPVTFDYDPATKTLTGCWAERAGDGKATGVIRNGVFSMQRKSLSFDYDDLRRSASGEASLTLSNTAQGLTLLGKWSQSGGSGAWTMTRDPVHAPAPCPR